MSLRSYTMSKMSSSAMDVSAHVLRYAAFADDPGGGNPAGVVLDASGLNEEQMLQVAREVGYSETAFLRPLRGVAAEYDVRYFSPEAEVPFCGHATIAAGVALAERDGPGDLVFRASAGPVAVQTRRESSGAATASLTSVRPHIEEAAAPVLGEALSALGWRSEELDPELPPRIAYAGARHLILAASSRSRLASLEYEFERLKRLMLDLDLTTIDLIWRERADRYHARNPFPVGGVYEDPATGAAAAAFGGYLRALSLVSPPARVTILQGHDMGRPSLIAVDIPPGDAGIAVTGSAVPIANPIS
jgi:PhzF family phenazine biosynthesis protein